MKRMLTHALALLSVLAALVVPAMGQGQLPFFSVWGNPTASQALPRATQSPVLGGSLTINANTVTLPAAPTGTLLQIGNANSTQSVISIDAFGVGNNAFPEVIGRKSEGTAASPTAVQSSDILFSYGGRGHDGSAWPSTNNAVVQGRAAENFTASAHGSRVLIGTTPIGSTAIAEIWSFGAAGGLSAFASPDGAPSVSGAINAVSARLNLNAAAGNSTPAGGILHLLGGNAAQASVYVDSYGTAVQPNIIGRASRGTAASPSATQSGDILVQLAGSGRGATALGSANSGAIVVSAAENFTDSALGGKVDIYTTPTLSTTIAKVASFASTPVLTLTPATATNNQGLLATIVGPTSGTPTGPIKLNLVNATHGAGANTAGQDSFNLFNTITAASRVDYAVGGTNLIGVHVGFVSALRSTANNTSSDKLAILGATYTTFNDAAGGLYAGVVGQAAAGSGAVSKGLFGGEFAVYAVGTATTVNRAALNLANYGSVQGSTIDAAMLVLNGTSAIGATSGGAFLKFVSFSNFYGLTPMATTAKLFSFDHAATIADVFDFTTNAVTITGNIFSFTNFSMTGAGVGVAAVSFRTPTHIGGTGTTGTQFTFQTTTGNGTTDAFVWNRGNNGATRAMVLNNIGLLIGAAGAAASNQLLTVTANAGSTLPAPITGSFAHFAQVDGSPGYITLDSFGTGSATAFSGFSFRRANGTMASPSTTANNDIIGFFGGISYLTTIHDTAHRAQIRFLARGTQSDSAGTPTAAGQRIDFYTTPSGGVATALMMTLHDSGGLAIGASTDPGGGGLYVNGATITFNGLATDATHTDRTVCQDTTSKSLFFGSGAAGICLGTSGMQFKKIVGPMTAGLAEIAALPLWNYYYRSGYGDDGANLMRGPTAQDVAAVIPDLARRNQAGDVITYDWASLLFVGLRAIQQLKVANDNLQTKVEELERRTAR